MGNCENEGVGGLCGKGEILATKMATKLICGDEGA